MVDRSPTSASASLSPWDIKTSRLSFRQRFPEAADVSPSVLADEPPER